MFVAVYNGTHVVGGSDIGCSFLRESGSHIPHSFLGYVFANSGIYLVNFVFYDILEYIHV